MTELVAIVEEDRTLTEVEASIKGHLATMVRGTLEACDARISIGHDLLDARRQFGENDKSFGQWCGERFPWTPQWRSLLVRAAENETVVRHLLETQVSGKEAELNFKKIVQQALPAPASVPRPVTAVTPVTGSYPTIVADPPWQYGNTATRGAAENHYSTMGQDELMELEIPAASDAHLYMWVTNGFVREGLDLLEAWGFVYKTMLTWIKPQIGLGNYFRNATEHVLFGLRGHLPTEAKDVPTWFKAPRGKHSAKPESFYDLVERVSPGPRLEMFARRRRMGWDVWGDQA